MSCPSCIREQWIGRCPHNREHNTLPKDLRRREYYKEEVTELMKQNDELRTKYQELLQLTEMMREALADTASWLNRMSDLKWDDPGYAPRFKIAFDRHREALAKYDAAMEKMK